MIENSLKILNGINMAYSLQKEEINEKINIELQDKTIKKKINK